MAYHRHSKCTIWCHGHVKAEHSQSMVGGSSSVPGGEVVTSGGGTAGSTASAVSNITTHLIPCLLPVAQMWLSNKLACIGWHVLNSDTT